MEFNVKLQIENSKDNREKGRVAFGKKRKTRFTKDGRHNHFIALEKESRKGRVTRVYNRINCEI